MVSQRSRSSPHKSKKRKSTSQGADVDTSEVPSHFNESVVLGSNPSSNDASDSDVNRDVLSIADSIAKKQKLTTSTREAKTRRRLASPLKHKESNIQTSGDTDIDMPSPSKHKRLQKTKREEASTQEMESPSASATPDESEAEDGTDTVKDAPVSKKRSAKETHSMSDSEDSAGESVSLLASPKRGRKSKKHEHESPALTVDAMSPASSIKSHTSTPRKSSQSPVRSPTSSRKSSRSPVKSPRSSRKSSQSPVKSPSSTTDVMSPESSIGSPTSTPEKSSTTKKAGRTHREVLKDKTQAQPAEVPEDEESSSEDEPERTVSRKRPLRCECPTDEKEVTFDKKSLWLKDVKKKDKELWLIRTPHNCDISQLQGKPIILDGSFMVNASKEGGNDSTWEIHARKDNSLKASHASVLLPSEKDKHVHPVGNFEGEITLTKTVALPPYLLPPGRKAPPPQIPAGLKMRNIPFGSGTPVKAPRLDFPADTEEKKKKKKKKKDKHHDLTLEDIQVTEHKKKHKKHKHKKEIC